MLCHLFNFVLYLALVLPSANEKVDLTVELSNIKELKGTMRICLIANDESKYLEDCDWAKALIVDQTKLSTTFEDLEKGWYCISIFHDLNDDEELNTKGSFSLPTEPYGFSNNPSTMFGPPKFRKCLFEVKEDKVVTIRLK